MNSAAADVLNFGFIALPHRGQASISRARAHGECSVRGRHKRTVGFIESAMPADGIPRCPFASNGDVGTSRLEEQL
jgi:hypothetical protein